MRLGRPRFSIRTGMILVGLVAGLLIASRWVVAKVRLDSALADYERTLSYYDEGRVTADHLIQKSRSLLDARFAWNSAKNARIRALEVHLERLEEIVKQERKDLEEFPGCRGSGSARLGCIEAEQHRDEAKALLASLIAKERP